MQKIITTKNQKKYIATSNDGLYWVVRSLDNKQVKSCGIIHNRQVTNTKTCVNGNLSPEDVANYLSTRDF